MRLLRMHAPILVAVTVLAGWPEYTALLGAQFDYHKDQAGGIRWALGTEGG